jgi:Fe-S-cluster-containing dehydrogenase component/DMSO reductase anchor subunit
MPGFEGPSLVRELLEMEQSLSAVEAFAQWHEGGDRPTPERHYRALLPARPPGPGEQYAFEVDLDKCTGCKACVAACHALNGLDENESWRSVGLLVSDDWRAPWQQTVTTACHHCVDPGCLNGCPVLAYDKDPRTGIVRHLDDQCIGCQYCVMMCPYEVPLYLPARGIVRKCDLCHERLGAGEAPACAQACPNQAIRITVVNQSEVRARYHRAPSAGTKCGTRTTTWTSQASARATGNAFLPASPDPVLTLPTTRFVTKNPDLALLRAADDLELKPASAHTPLVWLLVTTQLAVGCALFAVLGLLQPAFAISSPTLSLMAALAAVAGLLGGLRHLGQPWKAWRAFLGWRTSWFSREVIALGAFALGAATLTGATIFAVSPRVQVLAAVATMVCGVLGVLCSAMTYVATRRDFWEASYTLPRFLGTALLLGAAAALGITALQAPAQSGDLMTLAVAVTLTTVLKLAFENRVRHHLVHEETPAPTPLNKTARLLAGPLGLRWRLRWVCAVMGGIALPLSLALFANAVPGHSVAGLALASFVLCVAGEALERHLFFVAVAPARMPGGVVT